MEYRTIEGVELATVGMEWPASTGPYTCTFEHLRDAMAAANEDPHIMSPRLKLGHTSEINGELNHIANPFVELGDGVPAFGRVVNLRLENDGAVLVGDFVEVPEWLADAMPSAYPSRSTEVQLTVTTEGGKRYSAVITAVALLGPIEPAIKDLADLERFLLEGPSPEEERVSNTAIDASVATGTIRERFNFDWTVDNESELDTYWWWCRDVRVDPNEIIADDDEGGCWSVPFETDGKDMVTFGEPTRVREEFVPVEASATSVVANFRERKEQRVLASNLERPDKPAPKTAASSQPDPQEDNVSESTIDMDALRKRLGLPDDANEEQINTALGQEPEAEADETPVEARAPEAEPVAASVADERGVTFDKDAAAQLQAEAKEGRTARQEQLKSDDDALLAKCVSKGRIPVSAKAGYDSQLAKGRKEPEAFGEVRASTRKFLEGLPDNTIPVAEIGASAEAEGGQVDRVLASFGINRG